MTELEPRRGDVVAAPRGAPPVVGRLVSLAAGLRRAVFRLALAATAAAALIAFALLRHGLPATAGRAALTVLALVVAIAPPLILAAFWFLLGELARLPERLRALPMDARDHAEQLGNLAREARQRRGGWTAARQLWRLTRLAAASRELVTPYAPILPLLSLPFLASVVAAAAAAVVELLVAMVVVVVLLVT